MRLGTIAQIIESLDALEFYECGGELNCRIWGGFKNIHKDKKDLLVSELNAAIKPVVARWERSHLDDLSQTISGRYKDLGLVDESLEREKK